ncbi:MAG: hypothetical protein KTR24_00425, partial [Saprospiraceae bacterium]|nr:hypothetical protein [Saprospiraceae bacterium]
MKNLLRAGLDDPKRAFQLTAISRQAGAILVSILLVKLGWSTSEVGIFEQWFFIGSILSYTFAVGILQGYLALIAEVPRDARRTLTGTSYFLLLGLIGSFAVILWLGGQGLVPLLLGHADTPPFIGLVLIFFVLHLTGSLVSYIYLAEHQSSRLLIRYGVGYPLLLVVTVVGGIQIKGGLEGAIMGLLVFALVEQMLCIAVLYDLRAFHVDRRWAAKLWSRAWPLCLYAVLGAVGLLFDGWLVNNHYQDTSVFALFRYGARELPGSLAMAGAFGAAMLPLLVRDGNKGLTRMRIGSLRLMHLFLPLAALLMALSQPIYRFFYSASYNESAQIFMIYLLLLLSRWIFGHTVMIAKGQERILVVFSIVEVVINV